MENLVYYITRGILFICLLVIGYIISIPEKNTSEEADIF
jgi:hypothetical protein